MSLKLRASFPFWLFLLAAVLFSLSVYTLWWQTQHYFASPIYDDIFDRIRFYRAAPHWQTFLAYLVMPHNEHRIATTRIVEILDEIFFSGREILQVFVTNGLQVIGALGCFALFRRYAGWTWSLAENMFVATLLLVLFVNPNFFYTLIVPFQIQHTLMAVLCLAAAGLMALASEREGDAPRQWLVASLLVIALLASFTIGNAPVILLAAAAMALLIRWRPRMIGLLAGVAVLHTVIILLTTPKTGARTYDPVAVFKFLVLYLGGPFVRVDPWPASYLSYTPHPYFAVVFGLAVLGAATGFAAWRAIKPGAGGPLAVFGLMIIAMVVITGLAAGLSRAQFGVIEAVNKKYASFAALAWVGLLAVMTGFARERLPRWPLASLVPSMLFMIVVLPLCVLAAGRETRIWQKMMDKTWEAAAAVYVGVGDRTHGRDLYTEENQLRIYINDVEPRRRGLFSHFPMPWGGNVDHLLQARREVPCRSEVEALSPIPSKDLSPVLTEPGTPVSISGWTWMADDHAPPNLVVAVDANHRLIGAAFVTRLGARAEEWLGQKFDRNMGWFGFARLIDPGPVTFVALSRYGKTYCRLGGVGDVR